MIRNKRNVIGASAIVLFLLLLIFSGSIEKRLDRISREGPVHIVVWHYYNGSQAIAFDNLVMEFNNTQGAEMGIIVEAVSKSSVDDLIDAVTESAQKNPGAEELPNIFQCYLDTAVGLDEMGVLASLDSYLTEEEKSAYVDSYISEGIFGADQGMKLFPVAKSTELLVINETEFLPFADACGIVKEDLMTWEGLNKTAEKYYEYSGGRSFFGRDSFANYMIVGSMQLGEEIFQVENDTVAVNLNRDVMKRLWDNYYVPYVKGYYLHSGRFRTDDMKLGSIIAAVGSSSGMNYLPSELTDENGVTKEVNYRIYPVPGFEGTLPYAVQQGASMAVTKATEGEELACAVFLKWLTREENNIAFSVSSGYLPVEKSANDMKKIDAYLALTKDTLTDIEYETLSTAIGQVKDSTLYTSKGFSCGYEARNILNTSMIDLAMADREAVLVQMEAGIEGDEALAPYLTEENFETWYQTMCRQMEEICSE